MADTHFQRHSCRSNMLWWILATGILLLLARDGSACQWIVDRCDKDSTDQCKATLVWANVNGTKCRPSQKKSVSANASHPCSTDTCSFLMSWCSWGRWEIPTATCGEEASVHTRTRSKCCHPLTMEFYPYSPCSPTAKESQEKKVEYAACENHYYVAIILVVLLLIVVAISLIYFKCRKPTSLLRRKFSRRGDPQPESQPPPDFSQLQTPAVESTAAPTENEEAHAFMPSGEEDGPPKYEDAV